MIKFNEISMVNGRALVRQLNDEEENKLASGIVLPGKKTNEFKNLAVVLSVGGKYLHSSGIEYDFPAYPGDLILMRDGFGIEPLRINGEDFKVLEPQAVVAVLTNRGNTLSATETSITVEDSEGNTIVTIGE